MGTAKLDPTNPPRLSPEQRASLDALTPADIERNAESDPDNPPMTKEELARLRSAATVRSIRQARGMTQPAFASTYDIALARLRDWEQGRFTPDAVAMNYLEMIHRMPKAVEDTIAELRKREASSREGAALISAQVETDPGQPEVAAIARELQRNADEARVDLAEHEQITSGGR
jgi:putative transcriptional regulator